MHPDDAEKSGSQWRERLAQAGPCDMEYRMIAANGSTVYLRDYVTECEIRIPEGVLRGVLIDVSSERSRRIASSPVGQLVRWTLSGTLGTSPATTMFWYTSSAMNGRIGARIRASATRVAG